MHLRAQKPAARIKDSRASRAHELLGESEPRLSNIPTLSIPAIDYFQNGGASKAEKGNDTTTSGAQR